MLFRWVCNVTRREPVELMMTTGESTARRLDCIECKAYLGWTFVEVPNPSEEYKRGRHLLEEEALTLLPQGN